MSGQLKVAPEHVSNRVLAMMGKPEHAVYMKFSERYKKMNEACGQNQFLVPYLMSSHPGCTMEDAVELACFLRDLGYMPEQVQDFYPTPATVSTCMYYTGLDPRTMQPVYVEKNPHRKALQRALIQYRRPENYELVQEALRIAGRTDLIGFGPECLIRPRQFAGNGRGWTGTQKPSGSYKKAGSGRSSHNGGRITGADHRRGETHSGQGNRPTSGKKKTIRNVHKKK